MPQPPANDAIAGRLIDLYTEAHASLIDQLDAALTAGNRRTQVARLRELIRANEAVTDALLASTSDWLASSVPELHAAGAGAASDLIGSTFAWTAPHVDAVNQLAGRVWSDIAANLLDVRSDTRKALQDMVADATRASLLESRTATQAARTLAQHAAADGLWSVEYANGARHTIADYADSVIRTTTAEAYNQGSIEQCRTDEITHVEYVDGPGCHVGPGHDKGPLANGLVVALEDVVTIAHPRCVMPGQRVLPYGGITEMRRAWFSGPRCQVTVQLGTRLDHLSVGPHHPVLTGSGWKSGDQLREGDYLVHDQWADDARQRGLETDLDQMPTVEDLFDAILATGSHASVPATGDDLHGDAVFCQGEVDVVWPAGGLLVVGDPPVVKHAGEGGAFLGTELAGDGAAVGGGLAAVGAVDGAGHRFAFVKVVAIEVTHYEGWVFDMSTGSGVFACQQFIARNCRRALLPVVDAAVIPASARTVGPARGSEPATFTVAPEPRRIPRAPRQPRAPRTPRPMRPAARVKQGPAPGTLSPRSVVRFDGKQKARVARHEALLDDVGKIHGMADDGFPITDVVLGANKGGGKGGHFGPRVRRGNSPRRGKGEPLDDYMERYSAWRTDIRPEIRINDVDGPDLEAFHMLHELGHRIDAHPNLKAYFTETAGRSHGAAAAETAFGEFLDAAKATSNIKDAGKLFAREPKYKPTYHRNAQEIWARAYSQYMAKRLGGPAERGLAKHVAKNANLQWSDEEFATLAPLVENVLRAMELMK